MKLKLALGLFALSTSLFAEPALTEEDRAALKIGRAVLAVDQALQYQLPDIPSPEEVVKSEILTKEMVRAGQSDTRLYVWVTARINWEIMLAQGYLKDARSDETRTSQLNERIKYLQRVRYAIAAPR